MDLTKNACIPDYLSSIFVLKRNTRAANAYYRNTVQFLMGIMDSVELDAMFSSVAHENVTLEDYLENIILDVFWNN